MNTSHPPSERRTTSDHDAYFNAQFDETPVYVEPGQVSYTQSQNEMLVGIVGAGVLLAIYDSEIKMGAMAYVILPDAVLQHFPFLDKADPKLVEKAFAPLEACMENMKKHGAGKSRIKIRLFGGINRKDAHDSGLKNTVFVQEYLFRKGLPVFNADIGGPFIRRVHFFPTSGRSVRRLLKRESDFADMGAQEDAYNKRITSDA